MPAFKVLGLVFGLLYGLQPAEVLEDIRSLANVDSADAGSSLPIREVRWTSNRTLTLTDLASSWGLPKKKLFALNPDRRPRALIEAGTAIRVYTRKESRADRSVGAPNAGRLVGGVPMPQGKYWQLRKGRQRVYGTRLLVETLVSVFEAYGNRYADPEKISVGDISAWGGGPAEPHRSHQTGRDVDIRLIWKATPNGRRRLDLDRTWFVLKSLIDSGHVQSVYLSGGIQKRLRPIAIRELGEEGTAQAFKIVSHERGHRNHMHVRFVCPEGHRRCLAESRR